LNQKRWKANQTLSTSYYSQVSNKDLSQKIVSWRPGSYDVIQRCIKLLP